MISELDIGGLFFPPLLVSGIIAIPLTQLITRILGRMGAYRWLWHAHLFNTALFSVLTSALWRLLFTL